MYAKRIILIIVGLILAFFLFMVISFYLYPVFNPDADFSMGMGGNEYLYDYAAYGPAIVADLKKKVEALEKEVQTKRQKEMQDLTLIDSLFQANLSLEDEIAQYKLLEQRGMFAGGAGEQEQSVDAKIEQIAKSLLRLDEEELAQILNRLSDNLLIKLYNSSSTIQREKLMRSLEPGKAATIIRTVMS